MARDRKILKILNFQLDNGFYKHFKLCLNSSNLLFGKKNLAPNFK